MKVKTRKVGNFLRRPHNIILLVLLICSVYLVVIPLIYIFRNTLIVHASEANRVHEAAGSYTLYHWNKTFMSGKVYSTFVILLVNSLICAMFSCLIVIAVGRMSAWLVIRADIYYKKPCSILFMFLYIMPGWTLAVAWINFFKNSPIGGTTRILEAITGLAIPSWFAYGFLPIVLVTDLHYTPYTYILTDGIFKNMDSDLEEAVQTLRTSRFRIFTMVTLPLVKSAVLPTILLVFASGLSVFPTTQFLGLPANFYTPTAEMYSYLNGTNPGRGYVYAVVTLALGFSILCLDQRMLGARKSYTTVSGKSPNVSLTRLRKGRGVVNTMVVVFIVAVTLLPFVSFATESLTQVKGDYSLSNFTLRYWVTEDAEIEFSDIFRNSTSWKALENTLLLALCCPPGAGAVRCLTGYRIARKWRTKPSATVNDLIFLSYLISNITLLAVYLSVFSTRRGFIPVLYGTYAMLVLIGVAKYLPMASRPGLGPMFQISATLEEFTMIMGVFWCKRMCRILIPIQKTSIMPGYLLPFISCTRGTELFVLLYTPGSVLPTTLLFMYNQKGYEQFANTVTLLIVIIVISLNVIINKLTGASIDPGIGG